MGSILLGALKYAEVNKVFFILASIFLVVVAVLFFVAKAYFVIVKAYTEFKVKEKETDGRFNEQDLKIENIEKTQDIKIENIKETVKKIEKSTTKIEESLESYKDLVVKKWEKVKNGEEKITA